MSERVDTYWLFAGGLDDEAVVRAVEDGLQGNWSPDTTSESGRQDGQCRYIVGGMELSEEVDADVALREFEAADNGVLYLRHEALSFLFEKNHLPETFDRPHVAVSAEEIHFKSRPEAERAHRAARNVDSYLDVVRTVTEYVDFTYGFGRYGGVGMVRPDAIPDREQLESGQVTHLFWLNVFSPVLVRRLGRETIAASPAWCVEFFEDGSCLLVTSDNPRDPSEEWRDARDETARHLDLTPG